MLIPSWHIYRVGGWNRRSEVEVGSSDRAMSMMAMALMVWWRAGGGGRMPKRLDQTEPKVMHGRRPIGPGQREKK